MKNLLVLMALLMTCSAYGKDNFRPIVLRDLSQNQPIAILDGDRIVTKTLEDVTGTDQALVVKACITLNDDNSVRESECLIPTRMLDLSSNQKILMESK